MTHCLIPGCLSRQINHSNLSFHALPTNAILKKLWTEAITSRYREWSYINDGSKVCGLHFLLTDFSISTKRKTLLPYAVPSVFQVNDRNVDINESTSDKPSDSEVYLAAAAAAIKPYRPSNKRIKKCVVYNCPKKKGDKSISYHHFPKDVELRDEWIQLCFRKEEFNPNTWRICSLHFREVDFFPVTRNLDFPKRRRLRECVLPSRNLPFIKSEPETIHVVEITCQNTMDNKMDIQEDCPGCTLLEEKVNILEQQIDDLNQNCVPMYKHYNAMLRNECMEMRIRVSSLESEVDSLKKELRLMRSKSSS